MARLFSDAQERALRAVGLDAAPTERSAVLEGTVEGAPVALVGDAAERRDAWVLCVARVAHPLDLALDVGLESHFFGGASALVTGDAAFDGVFTVRAAAGEAALAQSVLDGAVRAELLALAAASYPRLTDQMVLVPLETFSRTPEELVELVRGCARAAALVTARAATLPAPVALRSNGVAAAFEQVAREHGLALRRNALCAAGALRSAWVSVFWRTQRERSPLFDPDFKARPLGYEVLARFHEPLGVGLTLRPASLADRAKDLVGLGDLRLGDPAFDRAWTIAARDEPAARDALHEGARAHLQRLVGEGLTFSLDDEGLTGRGELPTSPAAVPRVLRLVEGLRDALRPARGAGPYRDR